MEEAKSWGLVGKRRKKPREGEIESKDREKQLGVEGSQEKGLRLGGREDTLG